MRTLVAALLAMSFHGAMANPCEGVDRSFAKAERVALLPILSAQLGKKVLGVHSSMRQSNWQVIYVSVEAADESYLFFSDPPISSRYVALWSGAATRGENAEIEEWVLKNANGIPPQLAKCFAWEITQGHRDGLTIRSSGRP